MAPCKFDQILWPHFLIKVSTDFPLTLRIVLSPSDVDAIGVRNGPILSELQPFVSLVRSCGRNFSFSFQPIFIKLKGYSYHHLIIFYSDRDRILSAKVMDLCKPDPILWPQLLLHQIFSNPSRYCYHHMTLIIFLWG